MESFKLLKERRFGPFFWTQAFGAFNDNVFKSALAILIAYSVSDKSKADILVQISAALFVLPFFIFSWITGQICDKSEKSSLIRKIKILEIVIMLAAAVGFYIQGTYWLIFTLFLMGSQSSLFGPVKYSLLPQTLKDNELIGGNGLIAMATFLAILFGTILGGFLVSEDIKAIFGNNLIAGAIVLIAIVGWLFSRKIPYLEAVDPDLKIKISPIKETLNTIKIGMEQKVVFNSLLGVAWFWFYGFFFLASMPGYCRDILAGNEMVATFLLAMFSIGIGTGSVLCEKVSKSKTEIGLVALGALGLSLFAIDLYIIGSTRPVGLDNNVYLSLTQFLRNPQNLRVALDLILIGFSGGLYIVPLYAIIQHKSRKQVRSRVIAANNILDSIMMVLAAIFAIILFKLGLTIVEIFLIIALMNIFIPISIAIKVPHYIFLLVNRFLVHSLYNVETIAAEKIPENGPCIIALNHVSFIDPMVAAACCKLPPRFVMDKFYFDIKILKWIFVGVRCIPILPAKEDPVFLQKALDEVDHALRSDHIMVLFPEGFITKTGKMIPFKDGIEKIVKRTPVPVIPVALCGLWGSWFSRARGKAMHGLPSIKEFRRNLGVVVGDPIPAEEVTSGRVYNEVKKLKAQWKNKHNNYED